MLMNGTSCLIPLFRFKQARRSIRQLRGENKYFIIISGGLELQLSKCHRVAVSRDTDTVE